MPKKSTYVVTYDISEPRLLRKTAHYLETQGVRVQKSVFVLTISKDRMKNVKRKLNEILGDKHSVMLFPLCKSCADKTEFLGKPSEPWIII